MTDGQNTAGICCIIPEATGRFHKVIEEGNIHTADHVYERLRIPRHLNEGDTGYPINLNNDFKREFGEYTVNNGRPLMCSEKGEWGCWLKVYDQNDPISNGHNYEIYKAFMNDNGYTEGRVELNTDDRTLETCRAMRNDGIKVFTVGFALGAGSFNTNEFAILDTNNPTRMYIGDNVKENAVKLLKGCAGEEYPHRFTIANDAKALKEVYESIGHDIIKDVIRVES